MMLLCIRRVGHAVQSEIRTRQIALCWVGLQQMPLAVLEALPVQCNVCASAWMFVQAKGVEEGGFSTRAGKEEDGSLLEGFSHSWGLGDVPGAPGAPSWSAGG